jgi:serine phosphatase RsbU (regulator of sigma subunit)
MCLLGIFAYSIFLVMHLYRGSSLLTMLPNFLAHGIFITSILLNKHRRYYPAALLTSLAFLLYINVLSVLYGSGSGIETVNIVLCATPLVFFDDLRTIVSLSALSVILFFVSRYLNTVMEPVLSSSNLTYQEPLSMFFIFLSIFLMLLFFKNSVGHYSNLVIKQNDVLSLKNKEIQESIRYARRIQRKLLKFDENVEALFPGSFVFYSPRDIVSGDFYWFSVKENKVFGACGDCTGHGIPGAFMCMIGITLLNEIVNEKHVEQPDEILNQLRSGIIKALKQTDDPGDSKDGMDISLVSFNKPKRILQFAGANHNAIIIRNHSIIELKGDKQPVGISYSAPKPFTLHEISVLEQDHLYLHTDGFPDQFGGAGTGKKGKSGKKFKHKNLKNLLLEIHHLSAREQHEILQSRLKDWRGDIPQTDDVLVIGTRM